MIKMRALSCCFLFCLCSPSISIIGDEQPLLVENLSQQELFFLKRLTEFWKDHDFSLMQEQIEEFLRTSPHSSIKEYLKSILADLFYREQDYRSALELYEDIRDPVLKSKTSMRRYRSLYLLGHYDTLIAHPPLLSSLENQEELQFIWADSLFRKMKILENSPDSLSTQTELALKAKPLLLSLYETSYQDKVLLPLAEVHRVLGEYREASDLFMTLAEALPGQKEEFLLQAAFLQIKFDIKNAIETYRKIVDLGGVKAAESSYNELILLFQEGYFSQLCERAPLISHLISKDKRGVFHLCLGWSFFKLENYAAAIPYLEQAIEEKGDASHTKDALSILLQSAYYTQNHVLFDHTFQQLLHNFPSDPETEKALLLHAKNSVQVGKIEEALSSLDRLLSSFPHLEERESLLYNYAILLGEVKKWKESRLAFLSLLEHFPQYAAKQQLGNAFLHCSLQELKEISPEQEVAKKEECIADLQRVLKKKELFSSEEEARYRLLLCQLLFDLQNYSASLLEINSFCNDYLDHPYLSQIILLQLESHRALHANPETLIPLAEKALALQTDTENKSALQLQLFNIYSSMQNYDKAADYLYQAYVVAGSPVQRENTLWLAHHYYKKALEEDSVDSERANRIFKKILKSDENYELHFSLEESYLEEEALKWSSLLLPQEKKKLLSSLNYLQITNPSQPWKSQKETLFKLGEALVFLEEKEEALKIFDSLISEPSYYSHRALLEKSRLLFAQCQYSKSHDPLISEILSILKDLQIRKTFSEEPLYLEAALEYADIRTFLAPSESKKEAALFFLNRVKEDFNNSEDSFAKIYQEDRNRYPEQELIFQNYMKYIDAELLLLSSQEEASQDSEEKALALLKELLHSPHVTPYLKNRVENCLKEPHP